MKAVIDLGTNTFHLLIADVKQGIIQEYFKLQIPVKLGKGGINKGEINADAFSRGLTALAEFRKYLNQFSVTEVEAFATSAIRNASNGEMFLQEVRVKHQIEIKKLTGDEEAERIYCGVKNSFHLPSYNVLVMDIGGGSVEFIIGNKDVILWKKSFEIGAARIIDKFQIHNPVHEEEIRDLLNYYHENLMSLKDALGIFYSDCLIGSAGSFETLTDIVIKDLAVIPNALSKHAFEIRREDFDVFCELMITSTTVQRSKLKGMVDFRIEMIVVAALLMKYVVEEFQMKRIISSEYSLKEGILFMDE